MGGLGIPSSQKIIVLQIWLVNSKPKMELYFLVFMYCIWKEQHEPGQKKNRNTQNRLVADLKYEDSTVVSLVAPFIEWAQ